MAIETVMNYISHSVNLDGVRAEEIKKSLAADVTAETGHAQQFARRIKTLSGMVPGSFSFKAEQKTLQRGDSTTDVVSVIKGVIEAERGALDHYTRIIKVCEGCGLRHAGSDHPDPDRTSRITCGSSRAT